MKQVGWRTRQLDHLTLLLLAYTVSSPDGVTVLVTLINTNYFSIYDYQHRHHYYNINHRLILCKTNLKNSWSPFESHHHLPPLPWHGTPAVLGAGNIAICFHPMERYPFEMKRYSVDKYWIKPVSRLVLFLESLPDPQVCSSTLHRSPAGKTFLESIDNIFLQLLQLCCCHLARTCPVCPRIRRELSRSPHVGGGGGPVVPLEVVAGYLQYLTSSPNKLLQHTF